MVREGTDVTILCYSRMRYTVMQAVTELEKQGYNPEVRGVAHVLAHTVLLDVHVFCWHTPASHNPPTILPAATIIQVIDLISLKPFDMETISKSIKKTRRAIIVEECMKTGGIGASLSAVINESLFDELDHPVVRLSSQDVPTAYAYELEAATIVQPEDVAAAVQRVVGGKTPVAA